MGRKTRAQNRAFAAHLRTGGAFLLAGMCLCAGSGCSSNGEDTTPGSAGAGGTGNSPVVDSIGGSDADGGASSAGNEASGGDSPTESGGSGGSTSTGGTGTGTPTEPPPVDYPDDPFGDDPEWVTVQTDTGWVEGPTWVPDAGGFIYNLTDRCGAGDTGCAIPDTHRLWRPGEETTEEYWSVDGTNHGAIWSQGLIFLANREPGRISYIDPSEEPFEETVIGDDLHRPNDLDRFSDGSLYFSHWPGDDQGVYRLMMNGDIERIIETAEVPYPNGIAFTADCKRLYVASSGDKVHAFDVDESGTLSNRSDHASSANLNGIAVDVAGNLYVPVGNGVTAFNRDGEEVGRWDGAPDGVINMTFGGEDHQWLLTTNKGSVSAVRTRIPGGECNGLGTLAP